jgi:hypothetical protein
MIRLIGTSAVALGLVLGGCGGGAEEEVLEEEEPSTLEICEQQCESAAGCDSAIDGDSDRCKETCEADELLVAEEGCEKEYARFMTCAGPDVECEATGSDPACSAEADDIATCMGG